jgi:hypothetical protein
MEVQGDSLPLAGALGWGAVRLGHSVLYLGAMELISALAKARVQHALEARMTQYAKSRMPSTCSSSPSPAATNAAAC